MKVNLDGLAAGIKEAIGENDPHAYRFMVDEMVAYIRRLEAALMRVRATSNWQSAVEVAEDAMEQG